MTSQRHSYRVDDDVLLDAARDCVLAIGVGRTTLTEVARRAQVRRMTLYRRFPGVRGLMAALMTREFGGRLTGVSTALTGTTARERLVTGLVTGVRTIVANPILRAALDLEPELLLPYVVQRLGSTQRLTEQFIAGQLANGHQDGSVCVAHGPVQTPALLPTPQPDV